MKLHLLSINNVYCLLVSAGMLVSTVSEVALADPVITVTWNCAGSPVDPDDYHVDYTDVDFPDVELKSECCTWNVKSVDTDNPGNIGDIGEIKALLAYNYGLSITDGAGGPGARHVKGINLDPSIASKYSKLAGGRMTGDLTGDLFLQESDYHQGGTCSFRIDRDAEGDITIPTVSVFGIDAAVSGDMESVAPYTDIKGRRMCVDRVEEVVYQDVPYTSTQGTHRERGEDGIHYLHLNARAGGNGG